MWEKKKFWKRLKYINKTIKTSVKQLHICCCHFPDLVESCLVTPSGAVNGTGLNTQWEEMMRATREHRKRNLKKKQGWWATGTAGDGDSNTSQSWMETSGQLTVLHWQQQGTSNNNTHFRSTQSSTLHGMVKWVSAYELSNNNKWRWCLRMIAADRRTHSPNRLVCSVCIHQMNRVNSRNDYVMMTAP